MGLGNNEDLASLSSKVSVPRTSVRALPVSELYISASLEAMVVVLLKEMSRDGEVSDKLLILAMTISPEHLLAMSGLAAVSCKAAQLRSIGEYCSREMIV
jgi:hypothetical protein